MGVAVAEAAHQASYQQARTAGNESALVQLLTSQLEGLGLEVYESSAGCTSLHEFCCTNLHAILRSPLGDGKESLVIVTSMNLTTGAYINHTFVASLAHRTGWKERGLSGIWTQHSSGRHWHTRVNAT
jgi:hypothetical protein